MGNVIISPNIRKESVRIDPSGNVINPRTKQIITPVEPEYVAPAPVVETEKIGTIQGGVADGVEIWQQKPVSKMDEMINKLVEKKVEEMVAKKVEEALSKL